MNMYIYCVNMGRAKMLYWHESAQGQMSVNHGTDCQQNVDR